MGNPGHYHRSLANCFFKAIHHADRELRDAIAVSNIIMPSPRFAVEALGMILIGFLAYYVSVYKGGLIAAVPVIGALAMGSQRLMPLVQLMYRGISHVLGNLKVLEDVVDLLNQPISGSLDEDIELENMPFQSEIKVVDMSFKYDSSDWVLRDVGIEIPVGSIVGFVGATGSVRAR